MPEKPFDMETSKKYLEGFNSGYLLRKFKPELSASILKNLEANSDYSKGLIDGNREYEQELDKEILKGAKFHEVNKDISSTPQKDIDKIIDRDYENP